METYRAGARSLAALSLVLALALALALLAHVVAVPARAAAEEAPLLRGDLPVRGGLALLSTTRNAAVTDVLAATRAGGCDVTLIALATRGAFRTYVPGAPPFVNAGFPSGLDASSTLVVRCAKPPPDVPDLHLLMLVTKTNALAADFAPADLVALPAEAVLPGGATLTLAEEAAEALAEMLEAARGQGFDVRVRSAYRSYAEQVSTYQYWVAVLGEAVAGQRSARPGHSEHQLGTVVDVAIASLGWGLEPALAETPEGRWLARNAERFGFVASYPQGAEEVTGYAYEPWHLRYIGRTHAGWLRVSGLALTEYLTALWDEVE
ncbi:MAG: M15 family metallopeptidase [Dehalococcoidia bacterium]|nr:M15 family metallopeptidase [Dehalococcoidia bacterium]